MATSIKEILVRIILDNCSDSALKEITLHAPESENGVPTIQIKNLDGTLISCTNVMPQPGHQFNWFSELEYDFNRLTTADFGYFFIIMDEAKNSFTGWKPAQLPADNDNFHYCHC